MEQRNFNHIFKNFEIEVGDINTNRYKAIVDICRKHDYDFENNSSYSVLVRAYVTPYDIQKFFEEVDVREKQLNNRIDITLTDKQKSVINEVLEMLADANICLCHDFQKTGKLACFNSQNGKVCCDKEIFSDGYAWFSQEDVNGDISILPSVVNGKNIYSSYNGGFGVKK